MIATKRESAIFSPYCAVPRRLLRFPFRIVDTDRTRPALKDSTLRRPRRRCAHLFAKRSLSGPLHKGFGLAGLIAVLSPVFEAVLWVQQGFIFSSNGLREKGS